ncbi:MAG: hypothetical protein M3M88_07135, partial [Thermoproteota archaeon]|nr:hypothetical protein [Thermoproteota archaeon]
NQLLVVMADIFRPIKSIVDLIALNGIFIPTLVKLGEFGFDFPRPLLFCLFLYLAKVGFGIGF